MWEDLSTQRRNPCVELPSLSPCQQAHDHRGRIGVTQLNNKKVYGQKTRDKAFLLYKEFEGNASKVARQNGMPSTPTIIAWAEEEDWDGKVEAAKELVRETLGHSEDPLVKRLVKDDVFLVEVLALLQGLAGEAIKRRRSKVMPRTTNELVALLKFISDEKTRRMGAAATQPAEGAIKKSTLRDALRDVLGKDSEELSGGVIVDLRKKLRALDGGVNKKEQRAIS